MRQWIINAGLGAASLAVFLALFEGLLATGALDDLSIHWIPPADKTESERIIRPSDRRSARNPFGFNGPIVAAERDSDTKARIMLLGDSFVWGFGLPYAQGLGQKLQRRVAAAAPGVEVLPFGRPGWATLHQLRFLENEATAYGLFEADMILVAFVVNDLDLVDDVWTKYRKRIDWDNAAIRALKTLIPNTVGFVTGHLDAAMEVITDDHGEGNWMEKIWSEPNLSGYREVLRRLKAFADAAAVPLVFALVPSAPNVDYHGPKFKTMTAMLDDLGIPAVDLLPAVVDAFEGQDLGRNYRQLWANPADSHPGDAMTSVLAEATVAYLEREGHLARLAAGEPRPVSDRFASLPRCENDPAVKLGVIDFTRYALADQWPALRVQGYGFELGANAVRPLDKVYVRIGGEYFPTLPRMPLKARVPGGNVIAFNGHFARDLENSAVEEAALAEIVGITQAGCAVFRPAGQPLTPGTATPPPLREPPLVRFGG